MVLSPNTVIKLKCSTSIHPISIDLADQAYNFRKQYGNMGTPYDYTSVMHYTRTVFTTEYGKATLTPIPDPDVPIGQIQGLSPTDILRIKKLYECCEYTLHSALLFSLTALGTACKTPEYNMVTTPE
ncbi:hypothetical protein AALO_G00099220 [Alosa alosa]|uniref:Metalloendopeptidase n=1 Tax=Alosa alosa TaxID=278164 RepID=A0AAV6GXC8_9TELE|nr:hypothetical protein AALO_G00099220 [Alosa alosa]